MVSLILVGFLAVLLAVNVSVAVAFGLTSVAFLVLLTDIPLALIPQQMFAGTDSTVSRRCLFFLLAGALIDEGDVSRRLVNLANVLVGWATGGLGHGLGREQHVLCRYLRARRRRTARRWAR